MTQIHVKLQEAQQGKNGNKKTLKPLRLKGFSGDPAGIRTPDPLLKRQLLCQLSYRIKILL